MVKFEHSSHFLVILLLTLIGKCLLGLKKFLANVYAKYYYLNTASPV